MFLFQLLLLNYSLLKYWFLGWCSFTSAIWRYSYCNLTSVVGLEKSFDSLYGESVFSSWFLLKIYVCVVCVFILQFLWICLDVAFFLFFPALDSLCLLNLWIHTFTQFWKILSYCLLECCLSPSLQFLWHFSGHTFGPVLSFMALNSSPK